MSASVIPPQTELDLYLQVVFCLASVLFLHCDMHSLISTLQVADLNHDKVCSYSGRMALKELIITWEKITEREMYM